MAVVSTGLALPGYKSDFHSAWADAPAYYPDLTTRIVSTSQTETYRWLGQTPQMREWGTGRLAKGLRSERYDVENGEYESTIEVDRKEIEDDQLGGIRLRIKEMALRARQHPDYLLELLLINGGAAGFNSYDGVTFFNNAHASGASANQDNDLTSTAADGTSPTTDEFKASVKQAIAQMLTFTDDVGLPIRPTTTGLVIVVHPLLLFTALEAINATMIASTSNVLQGAARVIALPGLTNAVEWFLLKVDTPVRPFIFQDRMPLEFQAVEEGSEESFRRGKYLFGVRARYAVAYGYWQYAIRTTFT